MPSSPAEAQLLALARTYDLALEALLRDDIEGVETLMQRCDEELRQLPDAALDNVLEQGARSRALEAHGRVLDAMKQARETTLHELRQVYEGRRALAGYGGRSEATGTRVSSDV